MDSRWGYALEHLSKEEVEDDPWKTMFHKRTVLEDAWAVALSH